MLDNPVAVGLVMGCGESVLLSEYSCGRWYQLLGVRTVPYLSGQCSQVPFVDWDYENWICPITRHILYHLEVGSQSREV